jgi:hypothetical protein
VSISHRRGYDKRSHKRQGGANLIARAQGCYWHDPDETGHREFRSAIEVFETHSARWWRSDIHHRNAFVLARLSTA